MISWQEICENPALKDLPYKIETNRFDQIVMSPSYLWHGGFQFSIGKRLSDLLPQGRVIVECAVDTSDGTKVPDVAWISEERLAPHRRAFSLPVCPEICVEILSSSNSRGEMAEKMKLYFEKGAEEAWICDEEGSMEFFVPGTDKAAPVSKMCPAFPFKIDWD